MRINAKPIQTASSKSPRRLPYESLREAQQIRNLSFLLICHAVCFVCDYPSSALQRIFVWCLFTFQITYVLSCQNNPFPILKYTFPKTRTDVNWFKCLSHLGSHPDVLLEKNIFKKIQIL